MYRNLPTYDYYYYRKEQDDFKAHLESIGCFMPNPKIHKEWIDISTQMFENMRARIMMLEEVEKKYLDIVKAVK